MISANRARTGAVVFAVLVVAAVSVPAAASPQEGRTERLSIASDGTQGDWGSMGGSISADERYVAFISGSTTFVPGDTNGTVDVFVRDRETGTIERVSVASDGTEGNGHSYFPSSSADGRYVAFWGSATNLVPGDTNESVDVFVHDRESGATERVSVSSDGTQGNDKSFVSSIPSSISADGRKVVFESKASNLVPGDTNEMMDVFVHDRETGTTERVSVGSDGTQGDWPTSPEGYSISADGHYVAFVSTAGNLVPGDTNFTRDVFVRDLEADTTERVSVASDGTQGNFFATFASLSADGRYVAFESYARNLVPGDTNGAGDVFVHDRQTGITERVSVASDGTQGNKFSGFPSISADGRHVAFYSPATNLIPGATNIWGDVYVHDRGTGATERVSVAGDGTQGNRQSTLPAISADGSHIVFYSSSSNLVPGDTNERDDVFLRDRGELPRVSLTYRGQTSEIRGRSAKLSARLFSEEGLPVGGRLLRFSVGEFEAEATTDENGDATVDMTVDQPYGSHQVAVSFPGDDLLDPAELAAPFAVLWEHEFADGDRVLRVNTIINELQFEAPRDVGKVKTDPDMRVDALPTGDTLIGIEYTDNELTVVGRFVPERGTFVATVSAPSGVHVLRSEP